MMFDDDSQSDEPPPIRTGRVVMEHPGGEGTYVIEMELTKSYEYKSHKYVNAKLRYYKDPPPPEKKQKKGDEDNDVLEE